MSLSIPWRKIGITTSTLLLLLWDDDMRDQPRTIRDERWKSSSSIQRAEGYLCRCIVSGRKKSTIKKPGILKKKETSSQPPGACNDLLDAWRLYVVVRNMNIHRLHSWILFKNLNASHVQKACWNSSSPRLGRDLEKDLSNHVSINWWMRFFFLETTDNH